jgi:hypothetical protein
MRGALLFFLFIGLISSIDGNAQRDSLRLAQADSLRIADSVRRADSLQRVGIDTNWANTVRTWQVHAIVDSAGIIKPSARLDAPMREIPESKDLLFYVLIAMLLVFAFLRNAFAKYFSDLFRLFFRTTLKQRQIRDQLMQTPLPSLLFNGFFVMSVGLYADFMLVHFKLIGRNDFWEYYFYCCAGLAAIYLVKFAGLKVLGWIFNLRDAADSYIFVVFVVNKVVGVFLLPFLVMIAFMGDPGYTIAVVSSWVGVGSLIGYRFILSYAAVRNQVRFNPFHFFLYLCAFEIAPLLLIYKLLLVFFQ